MCYINEVDDKNVSVYLLGGYIMCTYCDQYCVEDEPYRGDPILLENMCPEKRSTFINRIKEISNQLGVPFDLDENVNSVFI